MKTIRQLAPLLAAAAVLCSGCDTPPPPKAAPGPTRPPVAATPSPVQTPAAPAKCPESGVVITEGAGNAAMGLRVVDLQLVNCGTRPYTVNGYPDLLLLDEKRVPLAVRISRGSTAISRVDSFEEPPRTVTLKPGEWAVAGLVWRNTVTDATTPAANGAYLDIAPVAGEPRQTVKPRDPIDLGNTGKLGVSAWQASPR